jgi:hypothetical protein
MAHRFKQEFSTVQQGIKLAHWLAPEGDLRPKSQTSMKCFSVVCTKTFQLPF